ncbi:hypothetical protein SBADM41S_03706 [Streptomyces badius]
MFDVGGRALMELRGVLVERAHADTAFQQLLGERQGGLELLHRPAAARPGR